MYFSSIVSSSACDSRYAVVLHTLGTSAHRILAVGADERVLEEARNSGITQCLALSDALHRGWKPFSLASAPDSRGDS
jgi:hypothetical protein